MTTPRFSIARVLGIALCLCVGLGTLGCGSKADAGPTKLRIEGTDQMKFNLAELKVKAGAQVELTLAHTGKMPAATMGHNWVLLKAGIDPMAFSAAAMQAKDTDYIPAAQKGDVLAFTKVIGGGEETTITFTAPAAGSYDFLCTFPGHAALMKGKLIVE